MIALASDCLLFKMANGESIPYSPEMISIEFSGDAGELFDAEFVQQAAKAVFHYFKYELCRQSVSVGEFAQALEKVLRGFALVVRKRGKLPRNAPGRRLGQKPKKTTSSDLRLLLGDAGKGCELWFFPRLRDQLRQQLRQGQSVLRFHGLRGCVKQLAAARRWSRHCRHLEEQILNFL